MTILYKEKTTYVIARHDTNVLKNKNIHFLTEDFCKKLVALKAEEGKYIVAIPNHRKTTTPLIQIETRGVVVRLGIARV